MKNVKNLFFLTVAVVVISQFLSFHAAAGGTAFDAWLANATLKIFPDDKPPAAQTAQFEIAAARNEYAPFQVAVNAAKNLSGISMTISDFTGVSGSIPASRAALLLVENVTIEKPSISATRKIWPDPLPPYHPFDVAEGETRAVWVDLFVPAETQPGIYNSIVTVDAKEKGLFKLRVSLDVKDIVIPTAPHIRTAFGISYGEINTAHNVDGNSPEAKTLTDAYYWFLVEHRLSPYHIPVDFFSEDAHRYLDDPRVTYLRPPFSWDKVEMQRIADRMKETGWINKAVFYQIDEPEPARFPAVNKIGEWLHSFDPNLKLLITHGYSPVMEANIDVWVPVLTVTLDPMDVENLRKEVKKGKQLWWYTCIGPKWHGMNYFIDEVATAPRLHPWMNYLYGVTGILYWSTTHWGQVNHNPWLKTETFPTGNGDGHLLYPGSHVGYNGPVASLRLKMLREGMEDYELMYLLGETLKQTVERIGGSALEYDPKDRLFEHSYALINKEGRSNKLGRKTPYLMFVSQDYSDIDTERAKVMDEIAAMPAPPLILVSTEPIDNGYTSRDTAIVKGYIEPGTEVTVNGAAAQTKGGRFLARVPIQPGKNVVTIVAEKDGKSKTLTRTIYKN